ncbi:tobamovirus multiplication protein 1-like isoform x1 [Anaeramoeba ignava]|uniref:Tobamovirus multiplication protein 1-like isoform x1 n=1 Tax=Anaeramoeba ignava TaxID=1746090 RepID=A0A9Q0R8E6_ANAIG|nr:tobamovirus multiplication protein 1-like isoform x1 [Anaeramoeba ignava]
MTNQQDIINQITRAATSSDSPEFYTLSSCYFLVAILSIYELFRTAKAVGWKLNNETGNFRILILSFSTLNLLVRGFFTLIHFTWHSLFWVYFLYFKLPIFLQFCTFSIYILYLARMRYFLLGKETKTQKLLVPLFIVAQIIVLIGMIVFCYLDSRLLGKKLKYSNYENYTLAYVSVLFSILTILLVVLGFHFYKELLGFSLVKIRKRRLKSVMILIYITGSLFLIRAIWSFLSLFNANKLNSNVANWLENKEYTKYDTANLVYYFILEVFPAAFLAIVMHINLSEESSLFVYEENFLLQSSHLFDDPLEFSSLN